MSSNMAAPYETLFVILEILWITATSPKLWLESEKIGNLTNMTEFYPFLESKKVVFAI